MSKKNEKVANKVTDRVNSYDPSLFDFKFLINQMKPQWKQLWLSVYDQKPLTFKALENKLNEDTRLFKKKHLIFPPKKHIFETFSHLDLDETKVVILGQDPYHGYGQAHGLSFSVQDGVKTPPSLVNIFKELRSEIDDFKVPESGNLMPWLDQGVVLLNSALTVLEGNPNEYQEYWSPITDAVIKELSDRHPGGLVFMLWGKPAQSKAPDLNKSKKRQGVVDQSKHHVLRTTHPSPLSAHRGWFGCDHFNQANDFLKKDGKSPIDWRLIRD